MQSWWKHTLFIIAVVLTSLFYCQGCTAFKICCYMLVVKHKGVADPRSFYCFSLHSSVRTEFLSFCQPAAAYIVWTKVASHLHIIPTRATPVTVLCWNSVSSYFHRSLERSTTWLGAWFYIAVAMGLKTPEFKG